jgi:hypothetical protein
MFRRLIPLRVQWVSQATVNVARDPELLDLVARSGARVLSIGFESLSEESLASVAKGFNRPSRFREDIEKLRARGIQVIALIMVGLDGDTPQSFAATLRWLDENKISFLKLFTPAPYPGTPFHAEMTAAGRILDGDWGHYDYGSPIVQPRHMSADEMLEGFRHVYSGFYSVRSMLRRFLPPPRRNLLETLAMLVANAKVTGYLRRNPAAWGTISWPGAPAPAGRRRTRATAPGARGRAARRRAPSRGRRRRSPRASSGRTGPRCGARSAGSPCGARRPARRARAPRGRRRAPPGCRPCRLRRPRLPLRSPCCRGPRMRGGSGASRRVVGR